MALGAFDHCRNCLFWDHENQEIRFVEAAQEDRNCAQCSHWKDWSSEKGWCIHHERRNPIDTSDPAVQVDIIIEREMRKAALNKSDYMNKDGEQNV